MCVRLGLTVGEQVRPRVRLTMRARAMSNAGVRRAKAGVRASEAVVDMWDGAWVCALGLADISVFAVASLYDTQNPLALLGPRRQEQCPGVAR